MLNSGYSCKYSSPENITLQTTIRQFANTYNMLIDFRSYYFLIWGEELSYSGKCKCKLHDEQQGESFSFKRDARFWSCWGACKVTGGGVMEYHQRYLRKTTNKFATEVDALRDLKRLYPNLPEFRMIGSKQFERNNLMISAKNNLKKQIENFEQTRQDLSLLGLGSNISEIDLLPKDLDNPEDLDKLIFSIFTRDSLSRLK